MHATSTTLPHTRGIAYSPSPLYFHDHPEARLGTFQGTLSQKIHKGFSKNPQLCVLYINAVHTGRPTRCVACFVSGLLCASVQHGMCSYRKGAVQWDVHRPGAKGAHAAMLVCLLVMCMFQCATAGPPYLSPTTHEGRKLLSASGVTTSAITTTPAPSSSRGFFYFWKGAPWVTRFTMLGLAGIVLVLSITIAVLAKQHDRMVHDHSQIESAEFENDPAGKAYHENLHGR